MSYAPEKAADGLPGGKVVVPHEHLGLFDKPAGRRDIRYPLAFLAILFAAFLPILTFHDVPLGEIGAFVPVINAILFVAELILATMLFAEASIFHSRALAVLASGFIFIAALILPYVLAFPGAFAPDGLFGDGTNTPAWIMIFRRLGFPAMIICYAVCDARDRSAGAVSKAPRASVLAWISGALLLAAAATALPALRPDLLPPIFSSRSEAIRLNLHVFNASNMALILIAIAMLLRKRRSMLDVWLLVSLAGWLLQSLLNVPLHSRFTIGWYSLQLFILVSNLCVLIALIAETNRLSARLALSTAARSRERHARLMTIDGIAAAISHEIGQPLTAASTNVSAALIWMDRDKPDRDKAIQAMRSSVDAIHLCFEVLRSMRALFSKGAPASTEFTVAHLLRETVSLVTPELDDARISLQLCCPENLPHVRADRVQVQRVLVNLINNAIESMAATASRPRRLTIRAEPAGDGAVLIEVIDTGAGIPPSDLEKIFEPFYTTKETGTGLGLSLCRTIVEEHGGSLWAVAGVERGAAFRLRLPSAASRGRQALTRECFGQESRNEWRSG
ncbi:MAG TPA: ATP-binding protein [Allosphingosinicella sp.]|nr:ATP-binding protein [Allosphingosinicella sp.]